MNDRDDNQAGYYSKKELNSEFEMIHEGSVVLRWLE